MKSLLTSVLVVGLLFLSATTSSAAAEKEITAESTMEVETETPAVLRMLELGGAGGKAGSPWHLTHMFLGHRFNGSLQANISRMEKDEIVAGGEGTTAAAGESYWRVGSLFGADNQDREWKYTVTCIQKKAIQQQEASDTDIININEDLIFTLQSVRYFNRQTDAFEEEEQWALKKLGGGAKRSKKSGKKHSAAVAQGKRTVEKFPLQERIFSFTQAVVLPHRNGGNVPEDTPTVLYGSTPDVSSSSAAPAVLPIQISLENSQHIAEARSLTLIVGTPEFLPDASAENEEDDDTPGTGKRKSSTNSALNTKQLMKDKTEVFYLTGTSTRAEQGFFASSNFMLVVIIGFFGFRTWSGFKDAQKKIKETGAKKK